MDIKSNKCNSEFCKSLDKNLSEGCKDDKSENNKNIIGVNYALTLMITTIIIMGIIDLIKGKKTFYLNMSILAYWIGTDYQKYKETKKKYYITITIIFFVLLCFCLYLYWKNN